MLVAGTRSAVGALDLGASGGRVFALAWEGEGPERLRLSEVHRFTHAPQRFWQASVGELSQRLVAVRLCWDLGRIYAGLQEGLRWLGARDDLALKSFGIDTWGSDGTWMNDTGDLLGMVATGRDERWSVARDRLAQTIGFRELYRLTGTRSEPFCVLNQLAWFVDHAPELVQAAETYMPINSILHYYLSGERVAEMTWMSTTQLSMPGQACYQQEVFERLRLPLDKMPRLLPPGTRLGACHAQVASQAGLPRFDVIVPATHDTAAAYAAAPVRPGSKPILISSGTWTLIGMARRDPLMSDAAYDAGLTNIGGCEAVYLHAVVMGSWPAQELRREWTADDGHGMGWEAFGALAQAAPPLAVVLDIDDPVFYAPQSMAQAVVEFCGRTGQPVPETRAAMARAVYEGLALKIAVACENMQAVSEYQADEIVLVGGGVRNDLVNQWVADATGLPVRTGSANAAALGNALNQAMALGWIASLAEGRELCVPDATERAFEPRGDEGWARCKAMMERWRGQ
jgi:rhamnulokinase